MAAAIPTISNGDRALTQGHATQHASRRQRPGAPDGNCRWPLGAAGLLVELPTHSDQPKMRDHNRPMDQWVQKRSSPEVISKIYVKIG